MGLNTQPVSSSGVQAIQRIGLASVKAKFEAISATTATGRPTYEQLQMNGLLNALG